MWEDPIVEEVHRTRERLGAEYAFDVKAIFSDLRKRQVALGGRLIPQKRRAEPTIEADVRAGRLDEAGRRADADFEAGRCTPL